MQVLGIAAEHSFAQIRFADSLPLAYLLLSDYPALKVMQRYTGHQLLPSARILQDVWPTGCAYREVSGWGARRADLVQGHC